MRNNLQDQILQGVREGQLEKDLFAFKEAQKQYKRIVEDGKREIDEKFKQLYKRKLSQSKIHRSSAINRYQMMKAALKFKLCEQIFLQVQKQIQATINKDENSYFLILIQYIAEGAIRLFQPLIKVRCLEEHQEKVQKIIKDSQLTFHEIMREETGRTYELNLQIDITNPLKKRNLERETFLSKKKEDQECIGGIILTDETGNITYKNTFDTRINILKQICLPVIRATLWPKN